MIEIALRTSLSPSLDMSTPSMLIEPDTSSTIRNIATMIDDFPAPVLGSTISEHSLDVERSGLPSNNAYFLSPLNIHAESLQDKRKLRAILHDNIIDFEFPLAGPRSGRLLFWNLMWWLLFEVTSVIDDALDGIHVVLNFGKLPDHPSKGLE